MVAVKVEDIGPSEYPTQKEEAYSDERRTRQTRIDFTLKEKDVRKFKRYTTIKLEDQANNKKRRRLELQEKLHNEAVKRLAATKLLLTEAPGYLEAEKHEKTWRFKQEDILHQLDIDSAAKAFDLQLSFGPYHVDFTRNGRYLLIGGQKGSLSIIDCLTMKQVTESNVRETVRDVCFLQNETMWAAAQKKYVYIYDPNGLELHCLREHRNIYTMEFLPYHFLLSTIGEFGELRYLDVSTGMVPAAHKTKKGPCSTMCQNPATAVIQLGHRSGSVSLWTPNIGKPVAEFLAHGGKVAAMECVGENYLATAGLDGLWKLWDMRKFETINRFHYFGSAPSSIAASQTGIISIGFGPHVQIWKDVQRYTMVDAHKPTRPYLSHDINGDFVQSIKFRPYEDFCVIGSANGIQSIVVPGSCFANYDSYSADPYETKKQRQEREVHNLLEKLPATTITVDPSRLGMLDEAPRAVLIEEDAKRKELIEMKMSNERKSKKNTAAVAKRLAAQKKYGEIKKKLMQKRETETLLKERGKTEKKLLDEERDENGSDTQPASDAEKSQAGKLIKSRSALDR